MDLPAQLLQVPAVDVGDVRLDHGQDPGQHLQHRHLAPQLGVEGGELHPHHAAADDGQTLGNAGELQDRGRIEGVLDALDRDPRRHRAGGEEDVLRRDLLLSDGDPALALEGGRALQRIHAGRLEERPDPIDQGRDHLRLALLRGGEVEAHLPGVHSELGPARGQRVNLGRGQQRLGRDAADVQAGAAQAVLLDDHDACAELGRADG